ncbi:MAG: hypothetical protein AAB481_00385 [Patescibacteria group bacterium]
MCVETKSPYTAKNELDAAAAIREGGVLIAVTPEDYHAWRETVEAAELKPGRDAVPVKPVLDE